MTVGFKTGKGYIKCEKKHHFARLLGLFCQSRVRDYLSGKLESLPKLEEVRLHREPAAWGGVFTAT